MTDTTPIEKRRRFRELHVADGGFILPNPWDLGSARILEAVGFNALATTSHGAAAALGRKDGELTREEAVHHAAALNAGTALPLSADLENGFGPSAKDVEETVRAAGEAGIAGCSIEDYGADDGLYDFELAKDRIIAAVEANQQVNDGPMVLTARCENFLRGHPDLADTIRKLQAFQEAGADALYAPGLTKIADIKNVLESIDRPLNVLLLPGGPSAEQLHQMGVQRVSVGDALSTAAYAALVEAAHELLAGKSHDYYAKALAQSPVFEKAWG